MYLFKCEDCMMYFEADLSNVRIVGQGMRGKDNPVLLLEAHIVCESCAFLVTETDDDDEVYSSEVVLMLEVKETH